MHVPSRVCQKGDFGSGGGGGGIVEGEIMKEDIQEKSLSSLCSYSLCHQPTTSPLNRHAPKAP